jgi:hypothetical protein
VGLWKPATLAHEQLVFPICQYSTCTLLGSIAVKIFPSSHFGTQVDLDFLTSTIDRGAARPCTAASVSFPLRYTHNFFAICLRRCWWEAPGWGLKNNCGSAPPEKKTLWPGYGGALVGKKWIDWNYQPLTSLPSFLRAAEHGVGYPS